MPISWAVLLGFAVFVLPLLGRQALDFLHPSPGGFALRL